MFGNYIYSFLELHKAPFWIFVILLSLFIIFFDCSKLKSKKDIKLIRVIGLIYIVGSTLIFFINEVIK